MTPQPLNPQKKTEATPMSDAYIPTISLIASAIRNHKPRWSTGQIFPDEGVFSTYRWENGNRIIVARYTNHTTARAFTCQLNMEELLVQAFSVLCGAIQPTSPELIAYRTFISNFIMALPLCPDENVFMTFLHPHPKTHLVPESAESCS